MLQQQYNPLTVAVPETGETFALAAENTQFSVQPDQNLLGATVRLRDTIGLAHKLPSVLHKSSRHRPWPGSDNWLKFPLHADDPHATSLYFRRRDLRFMSRTGEEEEPDDYLDLTEYAGLVAVIGSRLFDSIDVEIENGLAGNWCVCRTRVRDWFVDLRLLCRPETVLAPGELSPIMQNMDATAYFQAVSTLLEPEAAWSVLEINSVNLRQQVKLTSSGLEVRTKRYQVFLEKRHWALVRLFDDKGENVEWQGLCRVTDVDKNKVHQSATLTCDGTPAPHGDRNRIAHLRLLAINETARHWFDALPLHDLFNRDQEHERAAEALSRLKALISGPEKIGRTIATATAEPEQWRKDTGRILQEALAVGDAPLVQRNAQQIEAVGRMLSQPFVMVHGPAGTGKTDTAVLMTLVSSKRQSLAPSVGGLRFTIYSNMMRL